MARAPTAAREGACAPRTAPGTVAVSRCALRDRASHFKSAILEMFCLHFPMMKPIDGYFLIKPEDLAWRLSNMMRIPNADFLERTGSELLAARLWRLPPRSANTLHRHPKMEEFYFVVEGVGRMRVNDQTLTVPKHGGVLVGPALLRQVFNDTDAETLWLIVGAPEKELGEGETMDRNLLYPVEPTQLPKELSGHKWPPG